MIPPGSRRIRVLGNVQLAATLQEAGLEVVFEPVDALPESTHAAATVDATLVPLDRGAPRDPIIRSAADGTPVVAVTVGGGDIPIRDRVPRVQRIFELALAPFSAARARVTGAQLAARLRQTGRSVSLLGMSDRSRSTYGLGSGLLGRGLLPTGWIVVASRDGRVDSIVATAVERVSTILGRPLRNRGIRVVESGKVLLELSDQAERRYIVRIAAGSSRPFLERALAAVEAMSDPQVPDVVRDKLVQPLATERLGPAIYALEPLVRGEHPRRLSARLWRDCHDFLVALHGLPAAADDPAALVRDELRGAVELLAPHVDTRGAKLLELLQQDLVESLVGVPLGWEHGDFWLQNLLVREGRLSWVLDWDTSAAASLPMLDLMDLIALSTRRRSTLTPGQRCLAILWPLARRGGDARMNEYAEATGTPRDRRTLTALARAYWLRRVARDLREYPDRQVRRRWIADNVHAPLADLERAW